MTRVLKNLETKIDINDFDRKIKCLENERTEIILSQTLRKNNVIYNEMVFSTRDKHKHLDIVLKIKKYDRVWLDNRNMIVAFWHYKKEMLYY